LFREKSPTGVKTMMLFLYDTKKDLKASIGQPLRYQETSIFGPEYISDGKITGARRPHLQGGGREFFATVTMSDGLIAKVQ
jgi:hypothetical protein